MHTQTPNIYMLDKYFMMFEVNQQVFQFRDTHILRGVLNVCPSEVDLLDKCSNRYK